MPREVRYASMGVALGGHVGVLGIKAHDVRVEGRKLRREHDAVLVEVLFDAGGHHAGHADAVASP